MYVPSLDAWNTSHRVRVKHRYHAQQKYLVQRRAFWKGEISVWLVMLIFTGTCPAEGYKAGTSEWTSIIL